jgi:hypothetical protein
VTVQAIIVRDSKVAAVPVGRGPQGAKGDPGGNVVAIGLFTAAGALTIAAGTDLVRTSGYSTLGSGIADYVADAAVNAAYVAANPRSSFISANARGFRLAEHRPVTPHAFGAAADGVTDDTAAVQAFWDFVIANNSPHDCSGVFGISDINADGKGLIIGPSVVPAVVPSQPLYGRMRLVALGQVNELVRIRNLTYRRWHGGIYAVGIGSASFASRTCLIGTYFENCARLHITDGVFGDNFALANVYCGTANNNMMKLGGVRGSNIGSGQVGNSLTANWSAPVNSGTSGSNGQRTVITVGAFPSAAIQSYGPGPDRRLSLLCLCSRPGRRNRDGLSVARQYQFRHRIGNPRMGIRRQLLHTFD